MQDQINEVMFEFAMTVSYAIKRGYEFVGIEYGERRLGIGPRLLLKKNGEDIVCYSPEDLESRINKEIEQ